jgi:hypothetical protein
VNMPEGQDSAEGEGEQTTWQRFLAGKTSLQLFVIALGALAGALLAIGAVVSATVRIVDGDDDTGVGAADGQVQRIESQSAEASEFVQFLLDHDGRPVQLDHEVVAERGPSDVSLQYDCDRPSGCSVVRLQAPDSIPAEIPGGLWFQGCYGVTKDGAGYGAQPLDIELRLQGATCPD